MNSILKMIEGKDGSLLYREVQHFRQFWIWILVLALSLIPSASGTSVFLVTMSAIVGVCAHAYFLVSKGELSIFTNVLSLLLFTIPGVVLGAQIGVLLSNVINRNFMGKFVGILFVILAISTFLTVLQ